MLHVRKTMKMKVAAIVVAVVVAVDAMVVAHPSVQVVVPGAARLVVKIIVSVVAVKKCVYTPVKGHF